VGYRYDLASRLTAASDASPAITAIAVSVPNNPFSTTYSYDALNRPSSVNWTPAPMAVTPTLGTNVSFTHTYNRTNQRIGQSTIDNSWWYYPSPTPSTVNYTANALNQHTAVGVVTPSYDGNGNLTGDGTFTYGYDSENRLTSASGAGNTSTYAYDARSNRKAPRSRLAGRSRSRLRPYAAGASLRLEAALPALPASQLRSRPPRE
jgi:YD repeat-containing protein